MQTRDRFHPMPRYIMRRHVLEKILRKDACAGKSILEIGYGAGEVFELYRSLCLQISGYDFSEEARQLAGKEYPDICLFKEASEIPPKGFDYVAACEVLEHIEDDSTAITSWNACLKDDGCLFLSVPAHQRRWDRNDEASGHYRRYEKKTLKELLEACGFDVELCWTYDFPSCLLLDPLRSHRADRRMRRYAMDEVSLEARTKRSGLDRDESTLLRALSQKFLLWPILLIQSLFYESDLGSAYLLKCRKRKESR